MTKKIYLDGYMDVPKALIAEVQMALVEHIKLTKLEAGCEKFDVVLSSEIEGRFEVSEIFVSKESFDNHQERVKNSNWGKVTKDFPRHYKIQDK